MWLLILKDNLRCPFGQWHSHQDTTVTINRLCKTHAKCSNVLNLLLEMNLDISMLSWKFKTSIDDLNSNIFDSMHPEARWSTSQKKIDVWWSVWNCEQGIIFLFFIIYTYNLYSILKFTEEVNKIHVIIVFLGFMGFAHLLQHGDSMLLILK